MPTRSESSTTCTGASKWLGKAAFRHAECSTRCRLGTSCDISVPNGACLQRLREVPNEDPSLEGRVVAVAADSGHHFGKTRRDSIRLVFDHGVEGDAHAGAFVQHRYLARRHRHMPNLRQVHLIRSELLEFLRLSGYDVDPGALGENITTAGLDLERMPLRTRIRLGPSATVELTGLRTPCVLIDRFRAGLKRLMVSPKKTSPPFACGVMAVVVADGHVAAGDPAHVLLPASSFAALPPL